MTPRYCSILAIAVLGAPALAAAQEPLKPEPGWGEHVMRTTGVRVKAEHDRVVAGLGLTNAQKKGVQAAYQKYNDACIAMMKPYWKTPWSKITPEQREKLHLEGVKVAEKHEANLRTAMGDEKYKLYEERMKIEHLKSGQAALVDTKRRHDASRDKLHDAIVKDLELTADQKKKIAAAEKTYRTKRGALHKENVPLINVPANKAKRESVMLRRYELDKKHAAELKAAMGDAKFTVYERKLNQAIEADRRPPLWKTESG